MEVLYNQQLSWGISWKSRSIRAAIEDRKSQDLKIQYDKKQAGAAMYEVVPSPKSEEVPEYVLHELAKKKPLPQVVQDEMNRGKNMDE